MARGGAIADLFGHVPQARDLPLAAAQQDPREDPEARRRRIIEETGLLPIPPGGSHTKDNIREQIQLALDRARATTTMDWPPWLIRRYTSGILYWVEWLKGGEGDRLLAEFKAEMDRLQPPLEHTAPNWCEHWGLFHIENQ